MNVNINYDREMEKQICALDGQTPKLLLHCCCAPCSSAVLERLDGKFLTDALYYNPNISPESEYDFRLAELKRLAQSMPLTRRPEVIAPPYTPELFWEAARGLEKEPEGGARCAACFHLRLEYTARTARALGYAYFGTTLTISPLKNARMLNEIGMLYAKKYGVTWLMSDFKKRDGYRRSVELSKEYDLYRQNYCGCCFSKMNCKTISE